MATQLPEGDACTGCGACLNACKYGAVAMRPGPRGFDYPVVDAKACTDCGSCESACPIVMPPLGPRCRWFTHPIPQRFTPPSVYAAWSLDNATRMESTSGGLFSELVLPYLPGGCVVGARYRRDFAVAHAVISSEAGLPMLRQSKYAQSRMSLLLYWIVSDALDDGKQVAFAGTPCQIAGLYGSLGGDREGLTTIDLVCRGVNSPLAFARYLEAMERRYGSRVRKVQFKNKELGWHNMTTRIDFENGEVYRGGRDVDWFVRGYVVRGPFFLRPSCGQCQFKGLPRVADISLGDFWGAPEGLDDNCGTSLVLVNSEKGRAMLERVKDRLRLEPSTWERAVKGNPHLIESAKPHPAAGAFMTELAATDDPGAVFAKYCE